MSHFDEGSGVLRKAIATERRAQVNQYVILAVLLFFVATYVYQWWRVSQAIKIDRIAVSNIRTISPSFLCPGDDLAIRYDLNVKGFGIIIADGAAYYAGQPVTYSDSRRIPSEGPATLTLTDEWRIPIQPDMSIAGAQTWIPGRYERLVTLAPSSSWVSGFVEPQRFTVPFTIREGC
jgi:hypothetical protein